MRDIILGFSKNWIVDDGTEQIKIEAITAPLLDNNRPAYHEASVKEVNFTDIPLLKLRSHFEQGMLGNSPALHRNARDRKIKIDPSICKIQPLEQVEGAEKWFKRTDNPSFQKLRHMNVLVFHDAVSDLIFLIPCTVIANYYLAHSKLLKAAMKMTTIDQLRLEIKKYPNGEVHIHLPPEVPAKLAPHIARFELDPIARNAFAAIHANSFHKPNRSIQSFHMAAPVQGNKIWHIQYVEPENSKVAWVTQIISCNSTFPFTTLLVLQDVKKYTGEGNSKRKARKMGSVKHIEQVELGQHSDTFFETVEISDVSLKNEYPGLSDVNFHKLKRVIKKEKGKKYIFTVEDMKEALALSTGVNGFGNNKIPLVPTETSNLDELDSDEDTPDNPDTRLDDFLNMIGVLEEKYVVNNIQFPQTTPLVAPLDENIFPFERGHELRDKPWHRKREAVSVKNGLHDWHLNTRRFIIKLAKIEKKFVYIVEFIYHGVADVGCTLLMVSEEELPDKTLIDRVVGYAKNKSGWATTLSRSPENQQSNGKRSSTYRVHKLAHKEYMKTPEKYCERIINQSIGPITEEK